MANSFHAVPYCWGKINKSQDDIKNIQGKFMCPKCRQEITNEDVADAVQLVDCVSLIKVHPGSSQKLFDERRAQC